MATNNSRSGLKKYDYINNGPAVNSNFFNGRFQLNKNNLDEYEPFLPGYAFIVWMNGPKFMGDEWDAYARMLEQNFKSFSGLGDMTMAFEQMSMGFSGNELAMASEITKENTSFTLKHIELAGSPITQIYTDWVTGIRDPMTGIATYNGKINTNYRGSLLDYDTANHSGELLYIVTDPTGGLGGVGKSIEFAAYYTNVIPTKVPLDHLNYTSGDHGIVEIDMEFRGDFLMSDDVNRIAQEQLAKIKILDSWKNVNHFGIGEGTSPNIGTIEK